MSNDDSDTRLSLSSAPQNSESCLSSSPDSSRDPSINIPSSDSHTRTSSTSLAAPNPFGSVKFAPLPLVETKKNRHPSFHYGLGARSRILRHRNSIPQYYNDVETTEPSDPPMRTNDTNVQGDEENDGCPSDDPILHIGRVMKNASKNLWRRVSSKSGRDAAVVSGRTEEKSQEISSVQEDHLFPDQTGELALRKDDKVEEEGRVWEEEISEDFRQRFSVLQTEEPDLRDKGTLPVIPEKTSTARVLTKRKSVTDNRRLASR